MIARTLLASAFVMTVLPVFAQSATERSVVTSTVAPKTQDFVASAAQSDMLEIETSKLALAKGDASIKAFATQMLADHTKTSAELKAAVADNKITVNLPIALDKAHQAKVDKLKKLDGADFVKEYKVMQVTAHKDAVSMFERYSKGGESAVLKGWAGKTLPDLQHHLMMAQELEKKS